jgi:hypothetical protein
MPSPTASSQIKDFQKRLKQLRARQGLTQKQLAEQAGLNPKHYRKARKASPLRTRMDSAGGRIRRPLFLNEKYCQPSETDLK